MQINPVTFADVANKIVDKTSSAASELIAKMGQTAPMVWQIAYRQTVVRGIESLLAALVCVAVFVVVMVIKRKLAAKGGEFVEMSWWIAIPLGALVFIIFSGFVIDSINYLANPAYWTVLDILNKLQGK